MFPNFEINVKHLFGLLIETHSELIKEYFKSGKILQLK